MNKKVEIYRPSIKADDVSDILTALMQTGCQNQALIQQFKLLELKIDSGIGRASYVKMNEQDRIAKIGSTSAKLTSSNSSIVDTKESELAEIEQYEKSGMFDSETITFMKDEIEQKYATHSTMLVQSTPSTLDL